MTNIEPARLTGKRIFLFWIPLAATWLMMAAEGPYIAAIIARLGDAAYNLAGFGVAHSIAMLVESPVIMMMSASAALSDNRKTLQRLHRFLFLLIIGTTLVMLILLIPSVSHFVLHDLIRLPADIESLARQTLFVLIPWPGAIGYRRFYQGILIKRNRTRRVAYGTVVRLSTMAATAFGLFAFSSLNGAVVGGIALSAGVVFEALATRFMAASVVKEYHAAPPEPNARPPLSYREIAAFYLPLALTSTLALGAQPMVTFFMGRSPHPVESLAVMPVINALVFIFRSMGLSFHEVGVALLGRNNEGFFPLRNFAAKLGIGASVVLGILAFTPLAEIWFVAVSGLKPELAAYAITPVRILSLMPALSVLLAVERAILVNARRTTFITMATGIEVFGIIGIMWLLSSVVGVVGATAAAVALIVGRLAANIYLLKAAAPVIPKE